MCRSDNYYRDADTFDPSRYLEPTSAQYKEPLTEFPKIQGHSVFGWGRRVCIGQEYAATQMLVVCAAVALNFNIAPGIDAATGKPVELNIEKSTANIIPIMESVDLRFEPRSEAHAERLREQYRWQKENDDEPEDEECF